MEGDTPNGKTSSFSEQYAEDIAFVKKQFDTFTVILPMSHFLVMFKKVEKKLYQPLFNHHYLNLAAKESIALREHIDLALDKNDISLLNLNFHVCTWDEIGYDGIEDENNVLKVDDFEGSTLGESVSIRATMDLKNFSQGMLEEDLKDAFEVEETFAGRYSDETLYDDRFFSAVEGSHRVRHYHDIMMTDNGVDKLKDLKATVHVLFPTKKKFTSNIIIAQKHLQKYSQYLMESSKATVGHTLNDSLLSSLGHIRKFALIFALIRD